MGGSIVFPSRLLQSMLSMNVKKRMAGMALYVSAFVVFAIGNGIRNAEGSCGDYLNHTRSSNNAVFSDLGNDSLPMTVCKNGNCRSAPLIPPAEPSRVVLIRRQPAEFPPILTSLNSPEVRIFEFFDEDLPSSAVLEVLAPPPILTV